MKYTSVYSRPNSNHWYVVFWDPKTQKRIHRSTPFLVDNPQGRRKATEFAAEKSKEAAIDRCTAGTELWENWVPDYLEARYAGPNRAKTLVRVLAAWRQWSLFLADNSLPIPRAVTYNHALSFLKWRTSQRRTVAKTLITKNTALTDMKIMSIIMREAARRGFTSFNPCEKLGIPRDPPAQKPEITDIEIATIREALKLRPEWMRVCFEMAIHQGCRLSETSLPLSQINLESNTITFRAKGRGGEPHIFTSALHPGLRPLIADLKARNLKVTCDLPVMAAKEWHYFFKEIELPHLKFHSTRVTVVTRLARSGVPIQQAMAYVGHASTLVHKIYLRLAPQDLSRAVSALSFGDGETPQNRDGGLATKATALVS